MRVALIGCGRRLSKIFLKLQKVCPEARVVGVLDPDEAGARSRLPAPDNTEATFHPDVASLIRGSRPDVVMVGTQCNLHSRYAVELAPYGLPIYLEKPVATTMEDAVKLERAWAQNNERVVVSFPLRLTHLIQQAKRWLDEPANGRVSHVAAVNYKDHPGNSPYFTRWYRDYRVTGGLFLQKATHDFDYLTHLIGSRIVRVAAMALHGRVHQDLTQKRGEGEPDVYYHEMIGTPETGMNEDCSSALFEFENGIHGTYSQVFFSAKGAASRGATLCGQRSTVRFDWDTERIERIWHQEPREEAVVMQAHDDDGHGGGDTILLQNLTDLAAGRAKSMSPLRAGVESVYTCLAAKESAATGKFITVRRWGA